MTISIQDREHRYDHIVRLRYIIIISKSISSFHSNSSNYLKISHSCIHNRNNPHLRTKQQPIHLYRNPNPTQWHPVKHKSWRRRRRANHLPVLAPNRPVSTVAKFINFCSSIMFRIIFHLTDRHRFPFSYFSSQNSIYVQIDCTFCTISKKTNYVNCIFLHSFKMTAQKWLQKYCFCVELSIHLL